MSRSVHIHKEDPTPPIELLPERERYSEESLLREEREEEQHAYSPSMTDIQIEAFITQLHEREAAWDDEQVQPTDSVQALRETRAERTRALMRRVTHARRC